MRSFSKVFLLAFFLNASVSSAAINDYIYKNSDLPSFSNYGSVGLIQMPTARFFEEGSLALNWSHNDPYINGAIIAYPFSWLEASYHYTDINNALYSDSPAFSGNQTYKDKGFDAKLRLLKESRYLPQIAVGARDVAGTSVFSAEYLVMSKRIKNIDLSFGLGWGTLSGNKIKNPLTLISDKYKERINIDSDTQGGEVSLGKLFKGDAGYFAGLEVIIPNFSGLRFKIEYDGTDYMKEGFPLGNESFSFAFEPVKQPSSKFNFGFVLPLNRNIQIKLAQTKGNNINFGFALSTSWGRENIVQKRDPIVPVENQSVVKKVNARNDLYLYRSAMNKLRENKFFLQSADLQDDTFTVNYTHSNHTSHIRALGRVATILDQVSPEKIKKFKIINTNATVPLYTAEIDRENFLQYKEDNLYKLSAKDIKLSPSNYRQGDHDYTPSASFPVNFFSFAPVVRSQIGGPDGFFFGDLRLNITNETLFSRNTNLLTSASIGIVSNLNEISLPSDSIIEHVRTDIVKYLQESEKYHISRLQFNYFASLSSNIYAKFSAGLFEEMFGGFGGEVLYRPFNQNFGIGAEIWRVRQRAYDMLFSFRDYETTTGHINAYYTDPYSKVTVALKGGRFLAEDSGINFDFSRRFKTGLVIGAFFSLTDISEAEFGEGSFDKGFYFMIPIETFLGKYAKRNLGWGLRPLTRDGAAYLNHSYYLWGMTEAGTKINLTRDWDHLYD
jgi:hypothetical protein